MRIQQKLRVVAAAVVAVVCLCGVGRQVSVSAEQDGNIEQDGKYSDQEVLQGLMYGVGPVADSVGIEVEVTGDLGESTYEDLVESTVEDFLSEYPAEIKSALSLVRSSNPLEVEEGLESLGVLGTSYAEQKVPYAVDDDPQPACGAAVVCVVYFAAAAHNTVAVTALAAVVAGGAIYLGKWTWGPSRSSVSAATREALVVDIIDSLKVGQ